MNADGTTTNKYSYEYDKLGQLVRFNDAVKNKTYTYTYDSNGNILAKSEYAYTLSSELGTATNTVIYGYDTQWKDKLTSVGDKTISYDSIGNPVSYLGATLTWEGRTLTSYEDETRKIQYEYDENGMRYRSIVTDKEDGQVCSYEYVWVDGKLISIVFVSDGSTSTAKYIYNDFDEPVGMIVTGAEGTVSTYYYLKNAQGDITNIVSSSGGKMVEFTYDVFGNQTAHYQSDPSTMVGMVYWAEQVIVHALTPFGYRGYCYDVYSGLYYLQSRYYDPQTGRFINADDTNYLNATGTVLGCNLFAYCENDPVNNVDPSGYFSENDIKNVITSTIKILSVKINNFMREKIGIWRQGKYWYISTSTLATAIDAVILIGSAVKAAIKSTAMKATCAVIRNYAKNNPTKFANKYLNKLFDFVETYLPNFFNVTFKTFLTSFGIKLGFKITSALISSRLQKISNVYNWISILTSAGNIMATILDVVTDGKWNKQVRI